MQTNWIESLAQRREWRLRERVAMWRRQNSVPFVPFTFHFVCNVHLHIKMNLFYLFGFCFRSRSLSLVKFSAMAWMVVPNIRHIRHIVNICAAAAIYFEQEKCLICCYCCLASKHNKRASESHNFSPNKHFELKWFVDGNRHITFPRFGVPEKYRANDIWKNLAFCIAKHTHTKLAMISMRTNDRQSKRAMSASMTKIAICSFRRIEMNESFILCVHVWALVALI